MDSETVKTLLIDAIEDMKAVNVVALDVSAMTSITDHMIICSGTSNRHVKSIAENAIMAMKKAEVEMLGTEGMDTGEWVLVDCDYAILHVMLPETRGFYQLEKLWDPSLKDE